MSKDKHRNRDKKLFVLANLPITDRGTHQPKIIQGFLENASVKGKHRKGVDVTKEIKQLEKEGKIERKRFRKIGRSKRTGIFPKNDLTNSDE